MKKIYKPFKVLAMILGLGVASVQAQTYCPSQSSSTIDEEIYNVMVNGANTNVLYSFTNGCTATAPGPGSVNKSYSNFKTLGALTTLIAGTSTSFSVAEDECDGAPYYSHGIGIWIDFNQNGLFTDLGENVYLDPTTFISPRNVLGTFMVPGAAATGSTVMRVIAAEGYAGSSLTPCLAYGYGETEDYRIDILPPVPCSGTPGANSITGPTAQICPNSNAGLALANNYTVVGLTYQWQQSTLTNVGPFTAVPGATNTAFSAPNVTVNTWYVAVITCTNTGQSLTVSPISVSVSPVITSTIPYYESFEGIALPNKLPNCSWSASGIPGTTQTYISSNTLGRIPRTGTKFASFYYSPAGAKYFYTNGIYMNAGITYSASVWYETEYFGYNNWSDLSIMYGTTQTTTGLVTIASTNGPAVSNVYKQLSNTFQVPTSGLYYVAIRGTGSTASYGQYLTWDDLSITIPCTTNSPNTPTISMTTNTTSICLGESINLTAAGADTFTWNTGSNSAAIVETPVAAGTMTYMVWGTNTLTGCMSSTMQTVMVNTTPNIFVIANTQTVCSGSCANLQALGASSYVWSNGGTGQNISVCPTSNTTYTVLATGSNGCTGMATQMVSVNQLPTITASTSRPNEMCPTETAILTAAGTATSFQWLSSVSAFLLTGNPVTVAPSATAIYTVTGTDNNGCQKSTTVVQNVISCTGISENTRLSGLNVYPNPTSGLVSIETNNSLNKTVDVIDVTGKVVATSTSNAEVVSLNLKDLSNGVYYVKIQSNASVEVVKVVKQ